METTTPVLAGTVAGMPADDYHATTAIGSSGLKLLAVSPAHYWAAYLDPEREPSDTAAFRFGRAWHCAVFEPEDYPKRYAVMPAGLDRRTNEGKKLWAEIVESGREVLSNDDAIRIAKMAAKAHAHPVSRVLLQSEHGAAEVSLFAKDRATGADLKIRPDWMLVPCEAFPNGLIVDGKTTTDASVDGFGRAVWNLEYGMQAAYYTRVFQQVFGTAKRPAFLWLAQEKDSPFAPAYYAAGEDLIAHFDAKIDPLLQLFARCAKSNTWPGYIETVSTLAMPVWAQREIHGATGAAA